MKNYIDLNGAWQVWDSGGEYQIPAAVPGCIHTDLLNANRIDDPFFADNEDKLQWISSREWIYTRQFNLPPLIYAKKHLVLACEGLDTLTDIFVNGVNVGQSDNMFRHWEFDIKPVARAGENTIEIRFKSPLPLIEEFQKSHYLHAWMQFKGYSWVRKQACNFGWDWGPIFITCGIWRNIGIIAYDHTRIADVHVRQKHDNGKVVLVVRVDSEGQSAADTQTEVRVEYDNRTIYCQSFAMEASSVFETSINDPQLWWPNGMGEQPLYNVHIRLVGADGGIQDQVQKWIGLRKFELVREKDGDGETFYFKVNGRPFFAKGANWIPADVFNSRVTYRRYEQLLTHAADSHMNMLRVWGGGCYEDDGFYDLCDKLGLCVWQDFMFACATYPTFDDKFIENVHAEVVDNVRRLRHHACLALWCGNNELEMGLVGKEWSSTQMSMADYASLFDEYLPQWAGQNDPDTAYWPSSSHTPGQSRDLANSDTAGDAHLWNVWHGFEPFEWYLKSKHRFISEFGFQSFPSPEVVRSFTRPQDRTLTSYVMDKHQKCRRGNSLVLGYWADWLPMAYDFEMMLWMSQILQAECIKVAIEHFRRSMPRTMGALYWQFNDCWPCPSWSSIDCYGNLKALHYYSRRFFSPLLVSAVCKNDTVNIYVTNDMHKQIDVEIEMVVMRLDGKELHSERKTISAASMSSGKYISHVMSSMCVNTADVIIYMRVSGEGVSNENIGRFVRPKYLRLLKPSYTINAAGMNKCEDGYEYDLEITSDVPALNVWGHMPDTDIVLSDNFFDLMPGRSKKIRLKTQRYFTSEQITVQMRWQSLADAMYKIDSKKDVMAS